MKKRIIYHGSREIVAEPGIRITKFNKDFYFGFYCTLFKKQAERWATRFGNDGYVNVYDYLENPELKILRFDDMTEEWLDFIVDSRKGKCPWEGYDIIEGGVADDRVIDAVEAYINGYADVEHTLRQLVYHKPNYQICILNQQIADEYLQYKSNERV